MSGADELKRFAKTLFGVFVDGELPRDETPLFDGDVVVTPPPAASSARPANDALVRTCARCDGEGAVLKAGRVIPCPEVGCAFRKEGA